MSKKHVCAKGNPNRLRNGREKHEQTDSQTNRHFRIYISRDFTSSVPLLVSSSSSAGTVMSCRCTIFPFASISLTMKSEYLILKKSLKINHFISQRMFHKRWKKI